MAKVSGATWIGLLVPPFAMVVIRYVVMFFAYELRLAGQF
jgi:hypothetical protein